jgi:hypothetical protein
MSNGKGALKKENDKKTYEVPRGATVTLSEKEITELLNLPQEKRGARIKEILEEKLNIREVVPTPVKEKNKKEDKKQKKEDDDIFTRFLGE